MTTRHLINLDIQITKAFNQFTFPMVTVSTDTKRCGGDRVGYGAAANGVGDVIQNAAAETASAAERRPTASVTSPRYKCRNESSDIALYIRYFVQASV